MYFNHPGFLYGLLAVLIPVIIHLFNFRRYKKLYFSNISFLKNITTQTRKQNKLKHIIVLILRLLAIIAIVIAFAEPVFKKSANLVPQAHALTTLFIDNSFSMMAEGENGRLFDEAVSHARELVSRSKRDSRFILLTDDLGYDQRRILTREAALNEIDRLDISSASSSLHAILVAASSIASDKDYFNYEMYMFSDFQKNSFDIDAFNKDTSAFVYLFPMKHIQKRNIYIDSCWMSDPVLIPNRKITLHTRLKNSSELDYEKIPLKLWINDQQRAVAGVDIAAGGYEVVTMNFSARETGWHRGMIEIADFPITFDDEFYFTYPVKKELNVLEIGNGEQTNDLSLFYGSDSLFLYDKMDYLRVKYDELLNYNLIVLNSLPSISSGLSSQLKKYMETGGNLLFIPNSNEDKTDENDFLSAFGAGKIAMLDQNESRVMGLKLDHPLFSESVKNIPENADLPVVFRHFKYTYHMDSELETLISLLNGDDFLSVKKVGNGLLYMLAVPLSDSYSNFSSHLLFVPVMYGVVIQGNASSVLYYTMNKNQEIILNDLVIHPGNDKPYRIKKYKDAYTFIPEQRFLNGGLLLDMHEGINTDGFYELILDDDPEYMFAFNYDRAESQLDFYTENELREQIESEGLKGVKVLPAGDAGYLEMLNTVENESQLWKLFIIFALLMLLAETLVLRFWK